MEMNIGGLDRLARIFVGVVLFYLVLIQAIGCWGYLGAILIMNGLSGMSLSYQILGINTEKKVSDH